MIYIGNLMTLNYMTGDTQRTFVHLRHVIRTGQQEHIAARRQQLSHSIGDTGTMSWKAIMTSPPITHIRILVQPP